MRFPGGGEALSSEFPSAIADACDFFEDPSKRGGILIGHVDEFSEDVFRRWSTPSSSSLLAYRLLLDVDAELIRDDGGVVVIVVVGIFQPRRGSER